MTARTQKLRLPLALALSGLIFTGVALAGAHFVIRPMLQSAVERDLTLAAQQLAGKLDQGMFERWQDITLGARRQVLRDRAGDSPEREVVRTSGPALALRLGRVHGRELHRACLHREEPGRDERGGETLVR